MGNHKKVLGIIYLISAAMHILFLFALWLLSSILYDYLVDHADPDTMETMGVLRVVIFQFLPAIVFIFYVLPPIIAGIALLTKQSWGLIFAMIVGCLHILSFPIGTAIGVYAIWIYVEDKKVVTAEPI